MTSQSHEGTAEKKPVDEKLSKKSIVCISCPIGCHLEIEYDTENLTETNIKITGNKCPRGIIYGKEEILAPKRMVTATVYIDSSIQKRLPVKTTKPIDKSLIFELLDELYRIRLSPPVRLGEPILKSFKQTGVNVISTMQIEK